MKRYKIKKTKKLIKQLKPYWKKLRDMEEKHNTKIYNLERIMEKETSINGIYFYMCDNEYVGIGNLDTTMELIHGHGELDK